VGNYAARFDVRSGLGHHGLKRGIRLDFFQTVFHVRVDLNGVADNQAAIAAVVGGQLFEELVGLLVDDELFSPSRASCKENSRRGVPYS
jgi:hypothetical protein